MGSVPRTEIGAKLGSARQHEGLGLADTPAYTAAKTGSQQGGML